jgi:hypothetical protein
MNKNQRRRKVIHAMADLKDDTSTQTAVPVLSKPNAPLVVTVDDDDDDDDSSSSEEDEATDGGGEEDDNNDADEVLEDKDDSHDDKTKYVYSHQLTENDVLQGNQVKQNRRFSKIVRDESSNYKAASMSGKKVHRIAQGAFINHVKSIVYKNGGR